MRPEQDISGFKINSAEMMTLLSMYDPYGMWRLELDSGHLFWSRDVYEIHGMEYSDGPVNFKDAMNAYHSDDALVINQLIEDAIAKKSGFRFVLRLKTQHAEYKLVKAAGKYRENSDGSREIIGLFSRFALPIRSIATAE